MRVALVSPGVFTRGLVVGGGERYAIGLAEALSRRTDTRLLIVDGSRGRQRVANLRLDTFPGRGGICGDATNPRSPEFLAGLASCDVVHCLGYHKLIVDYVLAWGKATGRPVFCTDVGGGGPCVSTYAERLGLRGLARLAAAHLALSEFAASYFSTQFRRHRLVYGGVDLARFCPDAGRRERRVVFVGRLLPHKGVDRLIRCLPADVPLTVAGRTHDLDFLAHLKQLACGKAVTFLPNASDEDIVALYRQCQVVVLPSTYRDCHGNQHAVPELLGLSLLEAMACGTPAVCTQVGGMPEVVRDGETGLIVPDRNESALREAVMALLNDERQASQMGAAARRRVLAEFTWDRTAERCLRAYREFAGPQP